MKTRIARGNNGPALPLTENGKVFVKALDILGAADLAEPFPMLEQEIEQGAIVGKAMTGWKTARSNRSLQMRQEQLSRHAFR